MKAERHSVQYGGHRIEFAIVRRERTTLEIAVEPDASVVVAAPQDAPLVAIEEKVRKCAAWIRRQQQYFIQFFRVRRIASMSRARPISISGANIDSKWSLMFRRR